MGFSHERVPRLVFLSLIWFRKDSYQPLLAEEALYCSVPDNSLKFPFEKTPWDWEGIEEILNFIYTELRIASSYYPVAIIPPNNFKKEDKKRLIITLFDNFQIPKLIIFKENDLILNSSYKSTGIVIDIGFSQSGYEITPPKMAFSITAKTFFNTLFKSLDQDFKFDKGIDNTIKCIFESSEEIDEIFYVSANYEQEKKRQHIKSKTFVFNQKNYSLDSERF